MTVTDLENVVSLQHALADLAEANARLAGIPDWMQELHEEHSAEQAEITALEERVEEAAHERRTAEAQIQDEQGKLARYQQQINNVKTQREYGALLQEIDTVKRQVAQLEEQALSWLERREEAAGELTEKRRTFTELDQRYAAELARWEGEKPQVAERAEELEREVGRLRSLLPRPMLSQFNRIYDRHGGDALAVIKTVDRAGRGPQVWACGACNFRVRPQVVVEIRNDGHLVQCDSCNRILFLEEEPQEVRT